MAGSACKPSSVKELTVDQDEASCTVYGMPPLLPEAGGVLQCVVAPYCKSQSKFSRLRIIGHAFRLDLCFRCFAIVFSQYLPDFFHQ